MKANGSIRVGINMTWKNLSGTKEFYLGNIMNIFEKVVPNTSQLNFYLWQKKWHLV